jgi:enterochelin esterase family protein
MRTSAVPARILLALAVTVLPQVVYAQATTTPPSSPGLKLDPLPTPSAGEWRRAGSTHRQALFPQTTDDGRYWFQFNAPNARSVQLEVGGRRYDYEKDGNGVWNLFIPYPGPGVKIVTVYVDGVGVPEPGTHMYYSNGWKSAIESPAPGEDYYAIRDVPHGDVREHWFRSDVTGTYRRMFVYTPPGYDRDTATRYPVLYLQHGAGEMEQEWTHSGLANFILDNLIAEQLAVPMIVVMNNGFANRPGEPPAGLRAPVPPPAATAPAAAAGASPPVAGAARPDLGQLTAFEEVLLKEVIPDVDRNFRTQADREHRALAGLSMGGGQAYQVGLRNLDTFSHIGTFSGAIFNVSALPEPMKDAAAFNRRVPVFFMSAGNTGSDLRFHASAKALVERANAAGVRAIFFESKDTQHEWQTWRRSLHAFAPLLFRE